MPKLLISPRTDPRQYTPAAIVATAATVTTDGAVALRGRAGLGLALWATGWLMLLLLSSSSPPVDNAEQLSWVRSLEWGYHKHPPLPTMLLWPLVQLFGVHEWVSYVAAGLVTGSAILLGRKLLCELCGRQIANIATLGTMCIGFYSHRLAYFNHDAVLMLCVTAAAWSCWRAFADRSFLAWIALGVTLGLGALAKYQVALAALSIFVYWTLEQGWRDRLHRRGIVWSAMVAMAVFSPHVVWLISHDFLPLQYAAHNSLAEPMTVSRCAIGAMQWIGDQLSEFAGALALGAGLLLWTRRRPVTTSPVGHRPVDPRARMFLFCWGVLPLALIPCMAVLAGAKLHRNWGSAYMLLTCAALMACVGSQSWQRVRWRDAVRGFAGVQAMLAGFVLMASAGHPPTLNQQRSDRFASQWVADAIGPPARQILGGDIRVIAGRQRLVSVLSLRLKERPLVLIDGHHELSPWLPDDMSRTCGILWVGGPGEEPPYEASRHEIGQGLWWAVEVLSDNPDACY